MRVVFDKLSREEKMPHWEATESEIRRALALVSTRVDPDIVQEVEDYLSHNELGLALESLEYGVAASDLATPSEFMDSLNTARARMGYPAIEDSEKP